MRKILTVQELIKLLLDYNMDANVYVNASGIPIGVALPDLCWISSDGDTESNTKRNATQIIFDIQEEERYNCKSPS